VRRRFGYRRLHVLLKREAYPVNHKKLFSTGKRGLRYAAVAAERAAVRRSWRLRQVCKRPRSWWALSSPHRAYGRTAQSCGQNFDNDVASGSGRVIEVRR
jgi:hypothetical protein